MFSFRKRSAQANKKQTSENYFAYRWRSIYSWLLLLLALFGGISYLLQNHTILPIKTIQLSGTFQYIDQQQIEATLRPFVGEGFFSLDIQQVRHSLSEKSWVELVSIRRIWPDRVVIQIVEKTPVARWDNQHLISDKANIFLANVDAFQHLPSVHGNRLQPASVLNQYYDFARRFVLLGETISDINIDNRGSVAIELARGFKIKLGRDNIDRKIARLLSIYAEQIKPRRTAIQQLDLRYSNGFAVAWKKAALIDRDEASLWGNNDV